MALQTYRPQVPAGRDRFSQLLRAEWTKLRSVWRWMLGLSTTVGLTLLFSLLTAAGNEDNSNDYPERLGPIGPAGARVDDALTFLHQPLADNGGITARVADLAGVDGFRHGWAKAGVMLRERTEPGSRYAAMLVTPEHGVRLQANYGDTDLAGSAQAAPRWLRLTRSGDTITGYESADGAGWTEVGTVELAGLSSTVEIGMFAASPDRLEVESTVGGAAVSAMPTAATGTFDNVQIEPLSTQGWQKLDRSRGHDEGGQAGETDGGFTVTGAGDIGPHRSDIDITQDSLLSVLFGQIAVIAVAVLFITSEYKGGMIRTSFAVSPRRGRVLTAKAVVLGTVTFAVGLVAGFAAFLVSQPIWRGNGFGPPAYSSPSLADGPVLRAVVGAAVFLALVAVLSLGVGAILRRSVAAIAVLVVVLVPTSLLVTGLPLTAAQWVMRATPAAGLSILQTIPADHDKTVEPWDMAPPWVGLGVLAAYAAAALAVAIWLVRRRDA